MKRRPAKWILPDVFEPGDQANPPSIPNGAGVTVNVYGGEQRSEPDRGADTGDPDYEHAD